MSGVQVVVAGFDVGETTGISFVRWDVNGRFRLGDLTPIGSMSAESLDDINMRKILDMVRIMRATFFVCELPFSNRVSNNHARIEALLRRWVQLQTMLDPSNKYTTDVQPSQWKPIAKNMAFYRPKDIKPYIKDKHCKDAFDMVGWAVFADKIRFTR